MARQAKNSDASADRAVSRHARGRARREPEHARRLCARPRRFLRASRAPRGAASPMRDDRRPARLSRRARPSAASRPPRWRGGSRRSASSIASSTRRAGAATIRPPSSKGRKRGRTLPKVLSIADVDRLLAHGARRASPRPSSRRSSGCAPRGSPACSRCSTPPGCASPNWSRCRRRRPRATRACSSVRGKGDKERLVPLNEAAKARHARLSRAAARSAGRDQKSKWLFPSFGESGHLTRQHFARDLKALAAAAGLRADASQPARAAPRLRQPSAAQRRRPARGADAARPRRHLDHADLHPRAGGAAQEPGARPAPARERTRSSPPRQCDGGARLRP